MQNLAIIVAISDYNTPGNNLPGTEKDGLAMLSLITGSGRFSKYYAVNRGATGAEVKSGIASYLESYSGQEIGDVVFYFSGHGEFSGDEFYYLMSDYLPTKRKQSSLDNTELDGMVRSLSPNMFVKIVDACHSGTPYIKDAGALEMHLKSVGKTSFKNICFMFSSQSDEYSYQSEHISFFTNSVISAVVQHPNGPVRYKSIMDYVSDEFEQSNTQTPLFINQAKFTEVFVVASDELKSNLAKFVVSTNSKDDQVGAEKGEAVSLVSILKLNSDEFSTKDEANAIILGLEDHARNGPFTQEIKELYDIEIEPEVEPAPQAAAIGVWIEKNNESREFFAKPNYESQPFTRSVPKNLLFAGLLPSALRMEAPSELVTEYRRVVAGYHSTADIPFSYISIKLSPKYRSIAPEQCLIAFIVSRSQIRFFWSFSHFEYIDWEKTQIMGKFDWSTDGTKLKNPIFIQNVIYSVIGKFCSFVEDYLRSRWGIPAILLDSEIEPPSK